MGGRSSSSGLRVADSFSSLPSSNINPLAPTKRATEVFDREYTALRLLARDSIARGEYNNAGYSTLHSDDEESAFSRRMLQGMQSKINSEWRNLELDEKLGVLTPERLRERRYALIMMQHMVNRYYTNMFGGSY